MEEKLVVAVDVINMKLLSITLMVLVSLLGFSQVKDNQSTFKKRVLETTEVDFLMSYYEQSGTHASVTGGIGNEKLSDIAPTIILAIPLSDDNILTIDAGISAYSSASSSNLNPFDSSGASGGDYDDDDDDDDDDGLFNEVTGSPWIESSGASGKDVWSTVNANYSHSSDDRNSIWSANIGFASEYDYSSIGFGGGFTKLFNQKILN